MTIIINEVAWGGTRANANDEWIELYNPGVTVISLTGWILKVNSTPISLSGTIPAGGYFILARNINTFSSGVTLPSVDLLFSTILPNSNASLQLFDSSNTLIDSANRNGGAWPAGGGSGNFPTMERKKGFGDSDSAWFTNGGVTRNGADSAGFSIYGTPKKLSSPTATPTRTRTPTRTPTNKPLPTPTQSARVVINEFLPHPGFDWNQDGRNNVGDEFIEIINFGPATRTLTGWKLDDVKNSGSDPFTIPTVTLKPGERALFYGSQTNILLSDGGDSVRLLDQRGIEMDSYNYPFAAEEDVSWCRIPDGLYVWYTDCVPTPNNQNKRGAQIPVEAPGTGLEETRCKDFPDTTPSDLLTAECNGFGSKFWNHMFWDGPGEEGDQPVWNGSKWGSFIQ